MPGLSPVFSGRSDIEFCSFLRGYGPAGEAMERTLHDFGVLTPGGWADWQASGLTPGGAPLMLQLGDTRAALSARFDFEDPAAGPRARLARAQGRLRRLATPALPAPLREVLAAAQGRGAHLRWGARLDVVQTGRRRRLGLCAEWPERAADLEPALVPERVRAAAESARVGRLDRVSHDAATGVTTLAYPVNDPALFEASAFAAATRLDPTEIALWGGTHVTGVAVLLRPGGLAPGLRLEWMARVSEAPSLGSDLTPLRASVTLMHGHPPQKALDFAPDWAPVSLPG